jgi:hypothetical protein
MKKTKDKEKQSGMNRADEDRRGHPRKETGEK